jgi:hypothetical protein
VIGGITRTYDLILANVVASAGADKTIQGNSNASGTNIARGNFVLRPGAPTGNAAGGSILLQSPTTGASGAVVQTLVTRLTITGGTGLVAVAAPAAGHAFEVTSLAANEAIRAVAGAGTDPSIRFNGYTDGAGVGAGTLTNAPAAGDPAFWLRVNIAGTDRFIPCW